MRTLFSLTAVALMLLVTNAGKADDYEFLDPATGKTWSPAIRQINGSWSDTYSASAKYAANFVSTNYSDWRIPTLAEMQQALADGTIQRINTTSVFPNLVNSNAFWTSDRRGNRQWIVGIWFDANGNVTSSSFNLALNSSSIDAYMVRP